MTIAINPQEQFEFTTRADKTLSENDPNRTVWLLRPLTRVEHAAIRDFPRHDTLSHQLDVRSGTMELEVVKAGLVGWRNFRDSAGEEVAFERGERERVLGRMTHPVSISLLDRIDSETFMELANAITRQNELTFEEGNA